jgi:hypothetical protein
MNEGVPRVSSGVSFGFVPIFTASPFHERLFWLRKFHFSLSNLEFKAPVLADMTAAPTAGPRTIPQCAKTLAEWRRRFR